MQLSSLERDEPARLATAGVEGERRATPARGPRVSACSGRLLLATSPHLGRRRGSAGSRPLGAKLNAWIFHWIPPNVHVPLPLSRDIFSPRVPPRFPRTSGRGGLRVPLYASGASTTLAYNFLFLWHVPLRARGVGSRRSVTRDRRYSSPDSFSRSCRGGSRRFRTSSSIGAFLPLSCLSLGLLDGGRRRLSPLRSLFRVERADERPLRDLLRDSSRRRPRLGGRHDRVAPVGEPRPGERPRGRRRGAPRAAFLRPLRKGGEAVRNAPVVRGDGVLLGAPVGLLVPGGQNKLWAPLTQRWGHRRRALPASAVALAVYAVAAFCRSRRGGPKREVSLRRRRRRRFFDVLRPRRLRGRESRPSPFGGLGGAGEPRGSRPAARVFHSVPPHYGSRSLFPRARATRTSPLPRQRRLRRRGALFVAVGAAGILVALGAHTPYYSFLFSLSVFSSGRSGCRRGGSCFSRRARSARGLGTLAPPATRPAAVSSGPASSRRPSALTAIEYRAAPIDFPAGRSSSAPVYRWRGGLALPGAVLELPIGFDYDAEHVFRSPAHWQRLVNGYTGSHPATTTR